MATAKARKPAAKKRTVRKKKKVPRFSGRIQISKVLLFLALSVFFFVSIAAAAYVIFFRVVIASADQDPFNRTVASIATRHASAPLAVGSLPNHLSRSTEKLHTGEQQ